MTVWIGRPGSMAAITAPQRALKIDVARQSTSQVTIGGGRTADYAPGVLRTWTFEHRFLDRDDHGTIRAFYAGHNGTGPWILIDGCERNLLTAQQSSAGSELSSTSGITVTAGTAVAAAWGSPRGPRQIAWSVPPGGGSLTLDPPRTGWCGLPVVSGQTYRWQSSVTCEEPMTVTASLAWLTVSGAAAGSDSGSSAVVHPGSDAVAVAVEVTAPPGVAWATPTLTASPGSGSPRPADLSTPLVVRSPGMGGLLLDRLQVSMPTTDDPGTSWAPGLGVPLVTLPTMANTMAWAVRHDSTLTLVEVR